MKKLMFFCALFFLSVSMWSLDPQKTTMYKRDGEDGYIFIIFFSTSSIAHPADYDGYGVIDIRDYIKDKGKGKEIEFYYKLTGYEKASFYERNSQEHLGYFEIHNTNLYWYNRKYEFIVKLPYYD